MDFGGVGGNIDPPAPFVCVPSGGSVVCGALFQNKRGGLVGVRSM